MFYRDTWAEINLDAIAHNIQEIRKNNHRKLIAVLKANAYGHGDYWVAKTAIEQGACMVAVAYLDEAIGLRKQGFNDDILVLGHIRANDIDLARFAKIKLTVISLAWLKQVIDLNLDLNGLQFHLKIDTGMNRIGLKDDEEILEAISLIKQHHGQLDGIYTHYHDADGDLSYCDQQYQHFQHVLSLLQEKPPYIHCENSAAILQYNNDCTNAMRAGLLLYGLSPIETTLKLKPALSLYSRMTHVKMVKKGETIGYGATYTAKEDCYIATLPIGYADGFIRANQGRSVIVNDEEVEIVGRICMDQCMIKLPHAYPINTKVALINEKMPVSRIAKELNTIDYEILCLLSDRIPRIVMKNQQPLAILNQRLHDFS